MLGFFLIKLLLFKKFRKWHQQMIVKYMFQIKIMKMNNNKRIKMKFFKKNNNLFNIHNYFPFQIPLS